MTKTNKELRTSTKEILSKLKQLNSKEEAKEKMKMTLDQAQVQQMQHFSKLQELQELNLQYFHL